MCIICGRATNGADKYVDGWLTVMGEEHCVRFWLNPSKSLDGTRRVLRCGWRLVGGAEGSSACGQCLALFTSRLNVKLVLLLIRSRCGVSSAGVWVIYIDLDLEKTEILGTKLKAVPRKSTQNIVFGDVFGQANFPPTP